MFTFHVFLLESLLDMSEYEKGDKEDQENPCEDNYQGKKPFSEVEIRNIRDFLTKVPVLSLSIHSYSQLFMWPYSYSKKPAPYNLKDLKDMAKNAVKALKNVNGTEFKAIPSADLCKSFNLQI